MIVVADTSALFAAFDAAQDEHRTAAMIMQHETLALSPLVITELDHLVHRDLGFHAAMQVMEAINARLADGQYKLAALSHPDLVAAHELRGKYADLRLDLADSVGVVLADRYDTNCVFTLDQRDYRTMTPLTKKYSAFRILPADYDTHAGEA